MNGSVIITPKKPSVIKELWISVGITVFLILLKIIADWQHWEPVQENILHVVLAFFVGGLYYLIITLGKHQSYVEKLYSDILKANNESREKSYRDLLKTNAVIPNHNNKLAFTASLMDFYDLREYHSNGKKDKITSIDLVREYSYQNLIFTPKYLHYLFYRVQHSHTPYRIIVIEEVCQATVTYILLSVKAGYRTYIICSERFKNFLEKYANDLEHKKILKGNPYMIKIDEDQNKYELKGKYTDSRNNNRAIEVDNAQRTALWNLLIKLKINSTLINNESDFEIINIKNILDAKNKTTIA